MRLLILTCMPHVVTLGGANKAIRLLATRLGRAGHTVTVAGPLLGTGPGALSEHEGASWMSRYRPSEPAPGTLRVRLEAHAYMTRWDGAMAPLVEAALCDDAWDAILVAGEDMSGDLLSAALTIHPSRTVVLAQTPNLLPWGEESYRPGGPLQTLLPRAAGVIACSHYLASYITSFGIAARACYLPIFTVPRMPLGGWHNPYISLINPCEAKGIELFVRLATYRPHLAFCGVPLWGTTPADRERLRDANVHVMGPFIDSREVWRMTRILLVPSTWLENFSLSVIEAMLHGVPVMVSDRGGLPEASLGAAAVLPTPREAPLEADVVHAWASQLDELLQDRNRYESAAVASRRAASSFARSVRVETFVDTLMTML